MTAQPHNSFVFCVVVVEFAVNGNQAIQKITDMFSPNHNLFLSTKLIKPGFHKANYDHDNDQF